MIGSIGPLTFGANQEMCLHLAYIYARGKSGPVSSVVELMKRADDLESKFQSGKIDNACNAAIKMSVVNMDETANSMFELFPNPANSSINIRYSGAIETKAHMFDILGKSVGQYWLKPGAENQINLSSLASGIYLIQVGEQTKKLVKE